MGVDAMVFVKAKQPVSEQDIRNWAYDMCSAFGPEKFATYKGFDFQQLAITKAEHPSWIQDIEDGDTLLEVHVNTRYYGPDYARGDWPFLMTLLMYLKQKLPQGTVYYGGDCQEYISEFTTEIQVEFWNYFVEHNRREYIGYGAKFDGRTHTDPLCTYCGVDVPMIASTWGGANVGYYCPACSERCAINKDGKRVSYEEAFPMFPKEKK